jgi:hypothetical protein
LYISSIIVSAAFTRTFLTAIKILTTTHYASKANYFLLQEKPLKPEEGSSLLLKCSVMF